MGKLQELLKELAEQEPEETVGDVEEYGYHVSMLRGNLIELADDLGYEINPILASRLESLTGAIIFTQNDEVTVETFENDEDLTTRWGDVAAYVESQIENQDLCEE